MDLLLKWQTLAGAFLGGIFALAAALVVAWRSERRQDLASAMLVVSTLVSVRSAAANLDELAEQEAVADDLRDIWLLEKLAWLHPPLSDSFEASAMRIYPLNVQMAAHVDLFLTMYRDVVKRVERVQEQEAELRSGNPSEATKSYVRVQASSVRRSFEGAARHAHCAEVLITGLILSRARIWNKVRLRLFPSVEHEQCHSLLRSGDA